MHINRDNYETIFLLYVDNELSATERRAVEAFVNENADLRSELDQLSAATLPAEEISFQFTPNLYKKETNEVLQEQLLLHVDGELDDGSASKLNKQIAIDEDLRKEWDELSRVKLDAGDKDIFENKSILYRHERSKVVSIRFWRLAAAAILILAFLITGITVLRSKQADDPIANNEPKNKIVPANKKAAPVETGTNNNNIAQITEPKVEHDTVAQELPTGNDKRDGQQRDQLANVENKKRVIEKAAKEPALENINNEESNENIASTVLKKRSDVVYVNKAPGEEDVAISKVKAPVTPLIDYDALATNTNSYAKVAQLNETPENDNHILYMSEERVTKSKVGVLFRKVKRVIERNTNIKTGNGVKIGGFEIAIK